VQEFLQNVINGLSLGSVYALIALGYTMVYGVLKFINFAHSDIFMFGAFGGIYAAAWFAGVQSPILLVVLVLLASMVICTVIALIIERIAYRPLRSAPRLNVLITAIGVSLFLENLGLIVFGSDPRVFPALIPTRRLFDHQELAVTNIQVMVLAVSAILMVALHWVVNHTKMGTAMRALSYDIEIANLMGIPADRIIAFTFIIGSALAGSAAVLYGLSYPKIEPFMGVIIGIKAFVAAVFGGIGNIVGAAVGGILLGLAESFVAYYGFSSYRDAIAFGLLIFVLLFRPAGLFGVVRREKV
jgi:branched-chain amino acid transport system permease protein